MARARKNAINLVHKGVVTIPATMTGSADVEALIKHDTDYHNVTPILAFMVTSSTSLRRLNIGNFMDLVSTTAKDDVTAHAELRQFKGALDKLLKYHAELVFVASMDTHLGLLLTVYYHFPRYPDFEWHRAFFSTKLTRSQEIVGYDISELVTAITEFADRYDYARRMIDRMNEIEPLYPDYVAVRAHEPSFGPRDNEALEVLRSANEHKLEGSQRIRYGYNETGYAEFMQFYSSVVARSAS